MERQQAQQVDGRPHGGRVEAFPAHQNLQRSCEGVKATEGLRQIIDAAHINPT